MMFVSQLGAMIFVLFTVLTVVFVFIGKEQLKIPAVITTVLALIGLLMTVIPWAIEIIRRLTTLFIQILVVLFT